MVQTEYIDPSDSRLLYTGRIDDADPSRPRMIYPASSVHFHFHGSYAALTVENEGRWWDHYLGVIVDGEQRAEFLEREGGTRVELIRDSVPMLHDVVIFKRQDGCHTLTVTGLYLGGGQGLLAAPGRPARRMEVYGDSVSAGELCEAEAFAGREDPPHNGQYSNSWYSFGAVTARALGAELHDIAQGGIPLLNGTGWVEPPYLPGMEHMWNRIHYLNRSGTLEELPPDWDFARWTPHVVCVAVGQNDAEPRDIMEEDYHGKQAAYWRMRYGCLLRSLREKYPKALILCMTTILIHSLRWDDAIEEVCRRMGDPKIRAFRFARSGAATPGHPRISEQEEMAAELTAYLKSLGEEIWE